MFPPSLGPYICGRFHTKIQDSRTNNKKGTLPSDPKRPLAIYARVWDNSKLNTRVVTYDTLEGEDRERIERG